LQEIDRYTSAVTGSLEEQNAATDEIVRNVTNAAAAAKVVVCVLDQVAAAVKQTLGYADTVLKASETVAMSTNKLRKNVDEFLRRVAA
jgi:methyl-accepting chemotaxis protein